MMIFGSKLELELEKQDSFVRFGLEGWHSEQFPISLASFPSVLLLHLLFSSSVLFHLFAVHWKEFCLEFLLFWMFFSCSLRTKFHNIRYSFKFMPWAMKFPGKL